MLEILSMTIVVRAVSHKNNRYYRQAFLDECLYKLRKIEKSYISIELTFLKELMLIRQANRKSRIFATIGIF